jgi:hypothetical protein
MVGYVTLKQKRKKELNTTIFFKLMPFFHDTISFHANCLPGLIWGSALCLTPIHLWSELNTLRFESSFDVLFDIHEMSVLKKPIDFGIRNLLKSRTDIQN